MLNKAVALLDKCEVVALASINEQGYPRVCAITKIANDGIAKIYVATGNSSQKTKHFLANPKASISYYKDCDSVILLGKVNIVKDEALRRAMWQDWMLEHLPDGPEGSEYCLLEFVSEEATMFIDKEFVGQTL